MKYLIIGAYHLWIDFEQVVLSHLFIWALSGTYIFWILSLFHVFQRPVYISDIYEQTTVRV